MKTNLCLLAILFLPFFSCAQKDQPQDKKEEMPLYFVQDMPTYPGGQRALNQLIMDNIVYPEYEKSQHIEGFIFIKYIVEKDGTPTNFELQKGIPGGPGLDAEVLKACQKLEKFKPGFENGEPQRVTLISGFQITLPKDEK